MSSIKCAHSFELRGCAAPRCSFPPEEEERVKEILPKTKFHVTSKLVLYLATESDSLHTFRLTLAEEEHVSLHFTQEHFRYLKTPLQKMTSITWQLRGFLKAGAVKV